MKPAATIAVIFISLFAIVIIVLHFLRPGTDPFSRPTSEYAVGEYGWMMSTAFISMSIATFSLLAGLSKGIPKPVQSTAGMILLGIWGVAVLVAMSFPIDPKGTEPTTHGMVHRINGPISFLCLTIAIFLITKSFRRDENWRSVYLPAKILSWLLLAMFVVTGINIRLESGYAGLCQRVSLILIVIWYLLASRQLAKVK